MSTILKLQTAMIAAICLSASAYGENRDGVDNSAEKLGEETDCQTSIWPLGWHDFNFTDCRLTMLANVTITNGCADGICEVMVNVTGAAWTADWGRHTIDIFFTAGGSACIGPYAASETLRTLPEYDKQCGWMMSETSLGTDFSFDRSRLLRFSFPQGQLGLMVVDLDFTWTGVGTEQGHVIAQFWFGYDDHGAYVTPVAT